MQAGKAKKICNFAEVAYQGIMRWPEKLKILMRDRNLSAVARGLGWKAYRVSQMMGREDVPNALDAVALCKYLGTTVEEVFGEDASLAMVDRLKSRVKSGSADQAEKQALDEALTEVKRLRESARPASNAGRDKGRKTG
jgi:hypothetical protein